MKNGAHSCGISRRNLLTSSSAAAAAWMLWRDTTSAQNPAGQGEDRASAIKISAFKTFPVGNKTFLKIETNQKISGWGEISQLPPDVAGPLMKSMFELLDGENPTRTEHLWQKLYRAHRDFRSGAFMLH